MLKPGVRGFTGLVSASGTTQWDCWYGPLLLTELRLELNMDGSVLVRSTDVLAVWRECGRGNGLELELDMVGVADVMDQCRSELVRMGTSSSSSGLVRDSVDMRLLVRGYEYISSWPPSVRDGPDLTAISTLLVIDGIGLELIEKQRKKTNKVAAPKHRRRPCRDFLTWAAGAGDCFRRLSPHHA